LRDDEIQAAFQDAGSEAGRETRGDLHPDAGMFGQQSADVVDDEARGDRLVDAEPYAAVIGLSQRLDVLLRLLDVRGDAERAPVQRPPEFGRLDPACAPFEQRYAELALELAHGGADRGLG